MEADNESFDDPHGAVTTHAAATANEDPLEDHNDDDDIRMIVALGPMVGGSELAFRQLVRKHTPDSVTLLCYTPMLRAHIVLQAYDMWQRKQDISHAELQGYHDDILLTLLDIDPHETNLIVQLCASGADELADAARAILTMHGHIAGIDLNLGCPQSCAREGGFGAFLPRDAALQCIRVLKRVVPPHMTVSCKFRLQPTDTIAYAQALQDAGCDRLALHCRIRDDKHRGAADLEAGKAVAQAVHIPVLLNGPNVERLDDIAPLLQQTGACGILLARNFLQTPCMFMGRHNRVYMAASYLNECAAHPPPTALFIRKHLRWIFRDVLQCHDDMKSWQSRLWTFLVRPYLTQLHQFRQILVMYWVQTTTTTTTTMMVAEPLPEPLRRHYPDSVAIPTFRSIRHGYDMETVGDADNDGYDDGDGNGHAFGSLFGDE